MAPTSSAAARTRAHSAGARHAATAPARLGRSRGSRGRLPLAPEVESIRGHNGCGVRVLTLSPRGDRLASADDAGRVILWSLPKKDPEQIVAVRVLRGHGCAVRCVCWSCKADMLATGGEDARILLWNVAGSNVSRYGVLRVLLAEHMGVVLTLGWCPDNDGRLASAGHCKKIILWKAPKGCDADDYQVFAELKEHHRAVTKVAWAPDCIRLASVSEDERVLLWKVEGQDPSQYCVLVELFGQAWAMHTDAIRGVSWDQEESAYMVTVDDGGKGFVWFVRGDDPEKYCIVADFEPGECMYNDVEWLPYISLKRRRFKAECEGQAGDGGGELADYARYMRARRLLKRQTVVLGPGAERIATAGEDGTVLVWTLEGLPQETDIMEGKFVQVTRLYPTRELSGHGREVRCLRWGTRGEWVISGGDDGRLLLWNVNLKDARPKWGLRGEVRSRKADASLPVPAQLFPSASSPAALQRCSSEPSVSLPSAPAARCSSWGFWPYSPLPAPALPALVPSRAVSDRTPSRICA